MMCVLQITDAAPFVLLGQRATSTGAARNNDGPRVQHDVAARNLAWIGAMLQPRGDHCSADRRVLAVV